MFYNDLASMKYFLKIYTNINQIYALENLTRLGFCFSKRYDKSIIKNSVKNYYTVTQFKSNMALYQNQF